MRKTTLSAVSAIAIFLGSGLALAQTEQEPSGTTAPETETETMPEAETGTGTGDTTTGTDQPATPDTGTATGDAPEPAEPVSISDLRPLDGETEGVMVEGVAADDIVGGHLVNQEGERIASINDILVDSSGEPQGLLVGFGGFLGFMEKEVGVTLDRVEIVSNEDNEYSSDLTEEEIESMPEYEEPESE